MLFLLCIVGIREHYLLNRPPYPAKWDLIQVGMTSSQVDELDLGISQQDTRYLKAIDLFSRTVDGQEQELMIVYKVKNGEYVVEFILARLKSRFLFEGDNVYFSKNADFPLPST